MLDTNMQMRLMSDNELAILLSPLLQVARTAPVLEQDLLKASDRVLLPPVSIARTGSKQQFCSALQI